MGATRGRAVPEGANVAYALKRSDVTVRTYGCRAVISGTAEFGVTFGGQDRTVPLRFHSIWPKRPDGAIQLVSGQATGIPAKQ